MRIAREGWPFILIAWAILALLLWLAPIWAAAPWLVIAIWTIAFFRDPERPGPRGEDLVISPADGKIVSIIKIHEPLVVRGEATRISIFMSVMNVHVNRFPVTGTISHFKHTAGKFGHAAHEKASTDNEHADTGVASTRGSVLTRQIAGSIARRIVVDHGEGTDVRQGERMGLIRFGSRVDVFVPAGATILVKEGEVAHAGVTTLAKWT